MEEEGGGGAGSFVWAIAFLIIALIIVAVLFSGGFLGSSKKEVDVEIKAPSQ